MARPGSMAAGGYSQPIAQGSRYSSMPINNGNRTWGEFFGGSPEMLHFINRFNPEQQQVLSQLLQRGTKQFESPYEGFEPIRQNALSTFFQDVVPRLQEQFSASGSNSISSPIIQSNLSSAGASLAERLAGLQSQYGQQNQQTALQQLQLGLNPLSDIARTQRSPGFLENAGTTLAGGAGGILGLLGKLWGF